MNKKNVLLICLLLASLGVVYRDVFVNLARDWYLDENYSHGFLVVPIALYFVWERRSNLLAAPNHPSNWGLLVVFASLSLLLAGILGAELFTTEVSLLGTIAGIVLYIFGWQHLRMTLFPIAFLLLMIRLPAIVFNQITFPLQLFASRFGESAILLLQIPVLREGNVIHMPNISLEVAEACSGIRSLFSLLTLGIVYGHFVDSRFWIRFSLALATIPIAIVTNGARVAGTGVAAHYYGPAAAEGFFHAFSGWLVFIAAFIMTFFLHRGLIRLLPDKTRIGVAIPRNQHESPAPSET